MPATEQFVSRFSCSSYTFSFEEPITKRFVDNCNQTQKVLLWLLITLYLPFSHKQDELQQSMVFKSNANYV